LTLDPTDSPSMESSTILFAIAGAFVAATLVAGVMAQRVDNAQRLADLVRATRKLRARNRPIAVPARARRR
jgi:hypothetical protein